MDDWSSDLEAALASGDPEYMRAMLARVPKDVLHMAVPFLDQMAKLNEKEGKLDEALGGYQQLIQAVPGEPRHHAGLVRVLLKLNRAAEALAEAGRIVELAPQDDAGYRLQGEACEALQELPRALAAYREALRCAPGDAALEARIHALETEMRKQAMLQQALDPNASSAPVHADSPPLPKLAFDPALFNDPSIPSSFDAFRVDGLKQHLWRYSAQMSARNTLARLDDPVWRAAWDAALSTLKQARVVFHGSELGVFALRALHHGAAHALCVEAYPPDARLVTGMVQKHFLKPWHAQHAALIEGWSEEERRASFDEFTSAIDIAAPGGQVADEQAADCLVLPQIDHTLLGTGIVRAIRQYCDGRAAPARILPAKATVFAMAVEWAYPGNAYQLEPLNRLRWSLYPQALDLSREFWNALTEPVRVGEIDFADFSEAKWDLALPVVRSGTVDAIVFWFELDLGAAQLSNAPGGALQCIKPAVQYTDPAAVQAGGLLALRAHVEESRLYFETTPPATLQRTHGLPDWYVPMLGDRGRNDAYRDALARALALDRDQLVLDIGASCGLLSMMAARAGAARVVGCETDTAILKAGKEIVALNGLDGQVALVGKDCRKMNIPDDLPRRADLALFELFDCSLIGQGILHFLAYAREHLLSETARYLPAAARIRAMVVEYRLDRIWDIDASLLNPSRAPLSFINVDAARLDYRPLSAPFDVFAFDFASATPAPEQKELQLTATAAGSAGAVLFWFDLGLDDSCWISNDPQGENALHWKQGLQLLPEVMVDAGMAMPLVAGHDGSGLKFRWQHDLLPKEALSPMPRWDPRALAATSALEQQTQGLLQHCTQNPGEFVKVAEIAQRLAIDPAAHGLDPVIARRFASMFLHD